jgi:hypothetical protein
MQIGDVVPTKSIMANFVLPKGRSGLTAVSFKAPKGERFMFLLLGTMRQDNEFDSERALRDLGWVREKGV